MISQSATPSVSPVSPLQVKHRREPVKNYAKTSGDQVSASRKARFYQVRAAKALRAHHALKVKSEKYFTKVGL